MGRELVQYLSSADLEWLSRHLSLAGATPGSSESTQTTSERESWSARTEREFREASIAILKRQQRKHQEMIERLEFGDPDLPF
jgi:hypothetical protein